MTYAKTREGCRAQLTQVIEQVKRHADVFRQRIIFSVGSKIQVALHYLVRVPPEISDSVKSQLISKALFAMIASGDISEKKLFAELNVLVYQHLSQQKQKYTFVTHMAIDRPQPLKRRYVDGATIVFSENLQGIFRREFEQIRAARVSKGTTVIPDDYQAIKVAVEARNVDDAFTQASDKLDFLRALWNLELNRYTGVRWSNVSYIRPVNKLLLLPFYTIHHPNGKRATDNYWYELQHLNVYRSEKISEDEIKNMYIFEKFARKKLKHCAYHNQIRDALVRYVRALDDPDYHSAFIKLWSILEALTGVTDSRTSIKDFCSDIASLFSDRDYNATILESLRLRRNSLIHFEEYSVEQTSVVWATKLYVDALFFFHIDFGSNFSSISEALEFVKIRANLPNSENSLRRLSRHLKLARAF